MPTQPATSAEPLPRRYSYVVLDHGKGADLFKVWVGGGAVHLAHFASRAEALAFVRTLPVARVVVQ